MDDPRTCDLTKPFELYGDWWRSSSPRDTSVKGCLSYTPEHGLQLKLYSGLPAGEPDQTIWGEISGYAGVRMNVSLFDAIYTNRPNNPSVTDTTPHPFYFINQAILGTRAMTPVDLCVSSIQFSISDFESFTNAKPVPPHYDGSTIKVDYTPAPPFELKIYNPSMDVKIHTLMGWNSSLFKRSLTITYHQEMELDSPSPIPL